MRAWKPSPKSMKREQRGCDEGSGGRCLGSEKMTESPALVSSFSPRERVFQGFSPENDVYCHSYRQTRIYVRSTYLSHYWPLDFEASNLVRKKTITSERRRFFEYTP